MIDYRSRMPRALCLWLMLALVAVNLQLPVFAQTGDGARELLRGQERERNLRERYERSSDVRLEREVEKGGARLPEGETPCFQVDRIELGGEQSKRFRWALKAADVKGDRARGRCLGREGINLVVSRVQGALVARGYVTTQVLVPEQDLTTGVLHLTLVPGRISAVRFGDNTTRARWQNALPARPGDIFNLRQAAQALENFQRIPGVSADLQFVPSAESATASGGSDVVIDWRQSTRWRPRVWLDDSGSEATGRWQGGVAAAFGNFLGWNELGYVHFGRSLFNGSGLGTTTWSAHASVPFGYWTLGANVDRYEYHQTVVGAFDKYVYSGNSRHSELRLGRLLWRNAHSKTNAWLRGWRRASDNAVDDVRIGVQRRRMGGWEAGISQRRFWGQTVLEAGVSYRRGTGAFGAQPAPEAAFGEGTSRSKRILADAQLAVPFQINRARLRYQAQWRGQWNRTALIAQERFAIGGRYTVRGFDEDAMLTGERGWLLRNELGVSLGQRQEVYLGADHGHVGGAAQSFQSGHNLTGIVVGARGCSVGMQWDVFAGTPLTRPSGFTQNDPTFGVSLSSGC